MDHGLSALILIFCFNIVIYLEDGGSWCSLEFCAGAKSLDLPTLAPALRMDQVCLVGKGGTEDRVGTLAAC